VTQLCQENNISRVTNGARVRSKIESLKDWARAIKRDVVALWLAARDSRVPAIAKVVAGIVAAYALSPIDLIPDFIPVLGYLDDLVIVPLGIMLVIRLIPAALFAELRDKADAVTARPVSRAAALSIIAIWVLLTAMLVWIVFIRPDQPLF